MEKEERLMGQAVMKEEHASPPFPPPSVKGKKERLSSYDSCSIACRLGPDLVLEFLKTFSLFSD